ncbi:MAG: protein-L-isoaspartate O-methyltransferase family protein [Erythrobacter sp.]
MSNTTISPMDKNAAFAARKAMIDSQLRTSGVNEDFVLARMLGVAREDFLPEDKAAQAYIDRSIALENGGFLAAPLFYGKLLIEAAPSPTDRVLVIEGGTGYLAELVRPLVVEVTTLSADDAAKGALPDGTFSMILIDGAVEQLPDALGGALEENGLIVSGLVLRKVTRLASGRKVAGHISLSPVEDLGIPVLHGFDKPKSWTFS